MKRKDDMSKCILEIKKLFDSLPVEDKVKVIGLLSSPIEEKEMLKKLVAKYGIQ